MALFKKLDVFMIIDRLSDIMNYIYESEPKESQYFDYYADQLNEMANLAAEMYNELEELLNKIDFQGFPWKEIQFYKDDWSRNGAAWFNTAVCMLTDLDMTSLLEGEEVYFTDEIKEKRKRIRCLERLTKKQQMWLYTEVLGFVIRFLQLDQAFEVISSLIHELEYHQSFVVKDNGVIAPGGAYL